MNIIEFIEDKKLINDQSLSDPQKVALKGVYGLPLDKKEKQIYRKCTGESAYHPKEYREALFVCGRRSGKSDKIASNIALYEATYRDHTFSVGEEGFVVLVARDKRQARVLFKYCLGKLRASPILSKMVVNPTAEEIELNNGVRIAIYPCSVGAIRGIAPVCFIGDEAAFWKVEGRADVDKEVINSIRPGLAQFEKSKLILISTPYAKRGVVWEDYRKNYGQRSDTLVFQASTEFLNPRMRSSIIKKELEKDYSAASSEYLARFRQDLEAYVSQEIVEACVIPGRGMLPRVANVQYYAFTDPSGGRGDSFTLAIAHRRGKDKRVVIDRLEERKPPFKPKGVVKEFSKIMKSYGISSVMGDKYAGEWVSAEFRDANINYESSERNKSELYLELLPMLTQGTVELPDHPKMIGQITGLERRTRSSGKDLVDHYPGGHDDLANSIAGVCVRVERRLSFGIGIMSLDSDDEESGSGVVVEGPKHLRGVMSRFRREF